MELIRSYFPELTPGQLGQLEKLGKGLAGWNEKINLVSRKETSMLEERHLLHSMAIARFITFPPGAGIVDVGTGGGLPGLPGYPLPRMPVHPGGLHREKDQGGLRPGAANRTHQCNPP